MHQHGDCDTKLSENVTEMYRGARSAPLFWCVLQVCTSVSLAFLTINLWHSVVASKAKVRIQCTITKRQIAMNSQHTLKPKKPKATR